MTTHIPLLATSHLFFTLEVIPKQPPGFPAVIQNNMCARSTLFRAEDLGTLFGTAKLPHPFSFLQMKQSTLLNAPAVLQELPSHWNESKWKADWRKQPPYPTVNRNPWTAQVVCICSQVRKEGANKHELLTNPGSTNCILFQNSLCCPAQPRLASLQLALGRMRKKTSPFSPFHASMNSAHKQTHGGRYTTISGDLGPVTLYLQHWVNKLARNVLPSVLHCSRNISSMHEEISHWKMQIRTGTLIRVGMKAGTWGSPHGGESCSPIHCHPPALTVTDFSTFLKGQLKFLNSAVTDKESKVLLKNSSEANYFSFFCRLRAIYWGFTCSCLKLDLICLSSKCCKCKAISFTGFN